MAITLPESYEHCRQLARKEARNFYYSFVVLPPEKRAAMCAIYAFMRATDDIVDAPARPSPSDLSDRSDDASSLAALNRWRTAMDCALEGDPGGNPILLAFADVVARYRIPRRYFHDVIDGAEMDLVRRRYETFDDLYQYCYRVAGAVGIVCIHVWGFRDDPAAIPAAEACGFAFQLTNILRDLKEDAGRDRIYLPQEDLRAAGYAEEDLLGGVRGPQFEALMRVEVERAREHYAKALELLPVLHPDGRPTYLIMHRIYRNLLWEIERRDYDVYSRRVKLPGAQKARMVAATWLQSRLGLLDARREATRLAKRQ